MRLVRQARATAPYLAVCVVLGVLAAGCVITQAWLLAHAIAVRRCHSYRRSRWQAS